MDVLGPYITLAATYGWANLMFETNQGPSFPAHQFIYGATSAPSALDDGRGTYAAENAVGCLAPPGTTVPVINGGKENSKTYPCFQHPTLGTLWSGLPPSQSVTWRYYAKADQKSYWTAPNAIYSECGGSNYYNNSLTSCPGPEFNGANANVATDPKQVLQDIEKCQLQNLNWVTPRGQYSDHAGTTTDAGPQWVANVINMIGTSACQDNGKFYWEDTAIILTWDDWGGWYDHEPPPIDPLGYQLGFRVPMLFVSAYGPKNTGSSPRTCVPYIEGSGANADEVLDFGSIANFIEGNFSGGWTKTNEGLLGFADARALQRGQQHGWTEDLTDFFDVTKPACEFVPIPTQQEYDANYFINDQSAASDPDDE